MAKWARPVRAWAPSFINGIVETQSNVDLTNNDKITISFWWKPEVSSNAQCVLSHSDNFDNNNNSFGLTRNWAYQTYISVIDHNGSYNFTQAGFTVAAPYSFSFDHVLITIDRNFGVDEAKLFINNVEFGLAGFGGGYFNDLNGLFSSFKMCIGRRKSNSDLPYVGLMQDFRLYNRILNRQEKMSLYNE